MLDEDDSLIKAEYQQQKKKTKNQIFTITLNTCVHKNCTEDTPSLCLENLLIFFGGRKKKKLSKYCPSTTSSSFIYKKTAKTRNFVGVSGMNNFVVKVIV